jgi:hypothetical protein
MMNIISRSDAPAAVIMGIGFLGFGLMMFFRPCNVRANFDRFANNWKEGSWHPCKMPDWGLRLAGLMVLGGATLFFYIAYIGLTR